MRTGSCTQQPHDPSVGLAWPPDTLEVGTEARLVGVGLGSGEGEGEVWGKGKGKGKGKG